MYSCTLQKNHVRNKFKLFLSGNEDFLVYFCEKAVAYAIMTFIMEARPLERVGDKCSRIPMRSMQ